MAAATFDEGQGLFVDWDHLMARIAAAGSTFPRGTLAYQPLGFGWILGEIVRRVTTLPIERFVELEVLAAAGLGDLRLGVPVSEVPLLARSYWVDEKPPRLGGEVLVGGTRLWHRLALAAPVRVVENWSLLRSRGQRQHSRLGRSNDGLRHRHRYQRQPRPAKLVTRCAPIGSAVRAACVD